MEWLGINQQMRQRALELALEFERTVACDVAEGEDTLLGVLERAEMYYNFIASGDVPETQYAFDPESENLQE
jgi:hypothetical protein